MRFKIPLAVAVCVMYVAAQQDKPEAQKNPLAGDAAAVAAGRTLFRQTCQGCHGDEARGDRAPALTGTLRRGSADGEIFVNIRTGIRGSQMPPFSQLSTDEVWQLVSYLRSLGAPPPAPDNNRPAPVTEVTFDRLRRAAAEPQNWLTYWGDYSGRHYSPLGQVQTANVRLLQAQWALQLPGDSIVEAVPVVVDGVMFVTRPPGEVMAVDAATGRRIWSYQRTQKKTNPYESNRVNRGVAVLGTHVYFATLDAALVALDARTGKPVWETQVADTMEGYSITSAPLAIGGEVITGVAGGEYGARGFLDAYDAATGKRLWRFYTAPGPGEFGNDSWEGDSWQRGGSPTWLTGTYDPDRNTIYWPVGNPGPDINGDVRRGDNLFSCSVVALDAATGQRKWHYQFTPNDTHDWDSTEDLVLVNRLWHGQRRALLLHADRNGVFYVLDRATGKFLAATPYVRTSWASGWDKAGRPITTPGWRATEKGVLVYPALIGGTNFQAPSYSPLTGWMYVAYHDGGSWFSSGPATFERGKQYWASGGATFDGPSTGSKESQGVEAIDPETGKVGWKHEFASVSLQAGVLATAGGLVFGGSADGDFLALDARTGKQLWHFGTGAEVTSSPMSYAVHGRQYVAISTAGVLYSFALPQ
jgi:PQQ-dependent dehydrogenase (methanol/ethanol family)